MRSKEKPIALHQARSASSQTHFPVKMMRSRSESECWSTKYNGGSTFFRTEEKHSFTTTEELPFPTDRLVATLDQPAHSRYFGNSDSQSAQEQKDFEEIKRKWRSNQIAMKEKTVKPKDGNLFSGWVGSWRKPLHILYRRMSNVI